MIATPSPIEPVTLLESVELAGPHRLTYRVSITPDDEVDVESFAGYGKRTKERWGKGEWSFVKVHVEAVLLGHVIASLEVDAVEYGRLTEGGPYITLSDLVKRESVVPAAIRDLEGVLVPHARTLATALNSLAADLAADQAPLRNPGRLGVAEMAERSLRPHWRFRQAEGEYGAALVYDVEKHRNYDRHAEVTEVEGDAPFELYVTENGASLVCRFQTAGEAVSYAEQVPASKLKNPARDKYEAERRG